MHLPSVGVVQKSMLIRPPSRPYTEATGSRQGGGRRLAGSLSTLLPALRTSKWACFSCHRCSVQSVVVLTARAEARGCSTEGSVDAVGFIKRETFNVSACLRLYSSPPDSPLCYSYSCFKSCFFSLHVDQSVLFLRPTLPPHTMYRCITGTPRC